MSPSTLVCLGRARVRNPAVDPKSSSFQDPSSANTPSAQLPPRWGWVSKEQGLWWQLCCRHSEGVRRSASWAVRHWGRLPEKRLSRGSGAQGSGDQA